MPQVEHLYVADTNLFFECKKLEDLPWQDLDGDPVVILITKPVQAEIDKHKKATGRTKKRALETFARLREMLENNTMETVISQENPKVILRVAPNSLPDRDLSNVLDYSTNDDKIVGIVSTLTKTQDFPVTLLTDDTGPAMTAQSQGLDAKLIYQSWKRPPEQSNDQKNIHRLQKELDLHRSKEPEIIIEDVSNGDNQHSFQIFKPVALSEEKIATLIDSIKQKHPVKEDFTPPVPKNFFCTKTTFFAPDEDTISKYKNEEYPRWVQSCKDLLSDLHTKTIDETPEFIIRFGIKNLGNRPATNMTVIFEAQGDIMIQRPQEGKTNDFVNEHNIAPRLPLPPTPPPFKRQREATKQHNALSILELADSLTSPSSLLKLQKAAGYFQSQSISNFMPTRNDLIGRDIPISHHRETPYERDPEAFYFSGWPTNTPLKSGKLTCDLFRHQAAQETFKVQLCTPENPRKDNIKGAVCCTVHAENLTKPVSIRIPVSIQIQKKGIDKLAEQMLDECSLP